MAQRKTVVKSRTELAKVMTKFEGGKSQAKIGDVREMFKKLIALEAAGYLANRKSIFTMLRKEAVAEAKKVKAKQDKKKAAK